ncbi:MAG: 50S ribosomal protein L22 [Candidatus Andersenbacteria bacterium]
MATRALKNRKPAKAGKSLVTRRAAGVPARTSVKLNSRKQAEAHIRYIHMAPQKVQRIAALVRGLPVLQAEALLVTLPKRAGVAVHKAIKSARANATHNYDMDAKQTWIESIRVGQSMELPRMMPRAQGRAYRIRKRFSHIDVVLVERASTKSATSTKQAARVRPAKAATTTAPKAEPKRPSVIRQTKMK